MTKTLKQATKTQMVDERPARLAALTAQRDELQTSWRREGLARVYLTGDTPNSPPLSDTRLLKRKAALGLAIDTAERERAQLSAELARDELATLMQTTDVASLTAHQAEAATALDAARQALDAARLAFQDAHAALATVTERTATLRQTIAEQEAAVRRWTTEHERDTAFAEAVDVADRRLRWARSGGG